MLPIRAGSPFPVKGLPAGGMRMTKEVVQYFYRKLNKEVFPMALFYDPKDATDLARVEAVLKKGGIEYSLRREPEKGIGPMQVHVAEEDMAKAEKLIRLEACKR